MRINDTLRLSGGARGVAHPGRVIFIEVCVLGSFRVLLQQQFVIFVALGHRLTAERNDNHTLQVHPVFYLFEKVQKNIIDNQEPVFGMVHDKGQFVGMKAEVQGVQHTAHSGDTEIRFQMGGVVPHQGCYSIAWVQSSVLQDSGQGSCTPV